MKNVSWLAAVGCLLICGLLIGEGQLESSNAVEASRESQTETSRPPPKVETAHSVARTRSGLLALYDFSSSSGPIVKDRSGVGQPLDLRITDMKFVRRSQGSLEVRGKTLIRSEKPAAKIIQAVRQSGEVTIEAWIRPAKTSLSGPARIVTLSKNANERNFTLGQERDRFEVRLRTTKTSTNGIPALSSARNSLTRALTHVVYTRDRSGRTRIYINGKRSAERTVPGAPSNWNDTLRLALANELSNDRPWQGTYFLVAVYRRDLLPKEVEQNFKAGAGALMAPALAQNKQAQFFETQIAALLAKHCLECHDSASKKGKLDLSRKKAAFAGGSHGKAIVPGKAAESRLWKLVESGKMPKGNTPLSPRDKKLLHDWIDAGAIWTMDVIDPAVYAHDGSASDIWVQRLTLSEYIETVRSAVGVDVAGDARKLLPPDLRTDGFSNTAYNLNVDLKHVTAYAKLAEIIVGRLDVARFAAKYTKSQKLTDDNMRGLISKMGKWLLRGPLEDHEITVYRGISTTVASSGGNFEEAVSYIIEAMLQSPRFIYHIENQRGDGTEWPVGEYELASRMSYILWGGPPDWELMRAADAGELADRRRVEEQVKRMLRDQRAVEKSCLFIDEWLDLNRLSSLQPNPKKFPKWDSKIAADMRDETLAFFKDVVWKQKRPLADLLNAQFTYATPRLAEHYGLKPKGKTSKGDRLSRYDVSAVPGRGGLLTQGSVLTIGGDEASMVTRGLFIFHDLLRGTVNAPPAGLDTTPVPTKAGLSQRRIADARIGNVSCGGCHAKFEPLAFGLEKYDGLGVYHEQDEHGNKLRDDGNILFPGQAKPVSYKSSKELINLLAGSERVRESMTWKVTQFALGRPLVAADARVVAKIHASTQKGGGTYAALITAIVMSDLVQMTRTEKNR